MSTWDCSDSCSSSIVVPVGSKGDAGTSAGSVITSTGTSTLTAAQSGATILLSNSAGTTTNLPSSPAAGTTFTFDVATAASTGNYVISAPGTAGNTITGGYVMASKSGTSATPTQPNALGSDKTLTLNGTTTGGLVGTRVNYLYTGSGWYVTGMTYGSGSLASPFS